MQAELAVPMRDADHERVLGIVFDISPAQAAVLSCLSRGTITSSDELLHYTGVKSNIKVIVSRTRTKLRESGLDIKSKINVGYWMDANDKLQVEHAVNQFVRG